MFIRIILLCLAFAALVPQPLAISNNTAPYSNVNDTDTSNKKVAPIHDSDIKWAIALEKKINKSAYTADSAEMKRYKDIAKRLTEKRDFSSELLADWAKPYTTFPGLRPSEQELYWALQLEDKVKRGYQPNAQETASYQNIASRIQSGEAYKDIQIQVNWALEWLQKTKNGKNGSAAEMAMFRWCQQLPEFQTQLEAEAQKQGVKIAIPEQ